MWVESLHLDNIKCFEALKLKLGSARSSYPWITLLGENGSGKSTILQALGLLLAGPEGAIQLLPRPEGWLRSQGKPGKMTARLHQEENDSGLYGGAKKELKVFQYTFYVTGSQKITINNKVFTEPIITEDTNSRVIPWLREHALLPKGKGWFGVGYGSFRRLTRVNRILVPALTEPLRYSNFNTQFNENDPLEAFEQWMVYLDYKILKVKDQLAKRHRDLAIEAINALLPEGSEFDSIDASGSIWFRTGGAKVPTTTLSDGFRSILALGGDLVWRLIEAFPESDAPLKESGVALIDELDIHLHPTWQRKIAGFLQDIFPRLQFIMATHSPIIAAGAGPNAVTYRCYIKDGSVHVEQVNNVHTYSVDRILQSDAFGLVSPYSEKTQYKIDRYYTLKRKKKLSSSEQEELFQAVETVGQAIGYEAGSSDQRLNEYLKKHWK